VGKNVIRSLVENESEVNQIQEDILLIVTSKEVVMCQSLAVNRASVGAALSQASQACEDINTTPPIPIPSI
jgi:hypothetical protein